MRDKTIVAALITACATIVAALIVRVNTGAPNSAPTPPIVDPPVSIDSPPAVNPVSLQDLCGSTWQDGFFTYTFLTNGKFYRLLNGGGSSEGRYTYEGNKLTMKFNDSVQRAWTKPAHLTWQQQSHEILADWGEKPGDKFNQHTSWTRSP
jgi:hypothetical protein